MLKKILIFVILFLNTACIAKNVSQKGYIFDNDDVSNINVGLTSKENALKYLGYPLNKSYFDDDVWYYYSYKVKEVLFFKPYLKDQKVLVLEFDKDTDLVKSKNIYTINSNKHKILKVRENYKKDKDSIIKDILKNIGQVSM